MFGNKQQKAVPVITLQNESFISSAIKATEMKHKPTASVCPVSNTFGIRLRCNMLTGYSYVPIFLNKISYHVQVA